MINGLFDVDFRLQKLDQNGDPLPQLNAIVPWEEFRPTLSKLRDKPRKSTAGRKPFDVVLMFKILVLQSLYNISDDQLEFQIADRLSFMRFLNLALDDRVPDAKTIWLFRDDLTKAELTKTLFENFDSYLRDNGFAAKKEQIIDASIVSADDLIEDHSTELSYHGQPANELIQNNRFYFYYLRNNYYICILNSVKKNEIDRTIRNNSN